MKEYDMHEGALASFGTGNSLCDFGNLHEDSVQIEFAEVHSAQYRLQLRSS